MISLSYLWLLITQRNLGLVGSGLGLLILDRLVKTLFQLEVLIGSGLVTLKEIGVVFFRNSYFEIEANVQIRANRDFLVGSCSLTASLCFNASVAASIAKSVS